MFIEIEIKEQQRFRLKLKVIVTQVMQNGGEMKFSNFEDI